MIPKIAEGGSSFTGAGQYYFGEGKTEQPKPAIGGIAGYVIGRSMTGTPDSRVGFTLTRNLPTEDPREAFCLMQARYAAYLKERAGKPGRRLVEPVYAYSLSWSQDENPSRDEMVYAAETSLILLGMDANQAVIVQHTDKAYPHIHVVVNRVHPTEPRTVHTSMDRYRFSRWAEAYEREQGHIRCDQRVDNNARRDKGEIVKDHISKTRHEIESERSGALREIAA